MSISELKISLKYGLEKLIKTALKIFSVFPVVSNRVIFQSFSGRQYSDSPRAISEYLKENGGDQLEIIWAFNKPEDYAYLENEGIRLVRYKSLKYLYYALTSHVYVDNVEHWSILHFRPQQQVINTWHGGGTFKQVGADRRDTGDAEKRHVIEKMDEVDWFVSSSKAFSDQTIRGSFRYRHEILECGLPRNDVLVAHDDSKTAELRKRLGVGSSRLVLYAPTFRNDHSGISYDLDEKKLLSALKERFGGDWKLLVRWHYYLEDSQLPKIGIRTGSEYDMQQLLLACDVLITDYSSSIWDFSLLKKPCFLYAGDLEEYQKERTFYSDPATWPAIWAQDNDALAHNIKNFDEKVYLAKVEEYHRITGNKESGKASQTVSELIRDICLKK